MDMHYDVIVVGAGAWGSSAALHLADHNLRVLCLDRFIPPHRRGSTHGSRVFMWSSPRPEVHELQIRSLELWRDLELRTGSELLNQVGCLFVGAESVMVAEALGRARDGDPTYEVLEGADASRRWPWLRVSPGEVAVLEKQAGVLYTEAIVSGVLKAAASAGAELRFDEALSDWRSDTDVVEVATAKGHYTAETVIFTVGPWAPELLKWDLPLRVERQVMHWYADPEHRVDGVFMCATDDPMTVLYGTPEPGGLVKVAVHDGAGGLETRADDLREIDSHDVEVVEQHLEARVPHLVPKRIDGKACMFTTTPDRFYAIGTHPESPRVVVATGDSGGGVQIAPAVGELLAAFVTGERDLPDAVSPTRFASPAEVPAA